MAETEQNSYGCSDAIICLIDMKLPSLNDYVAANRANRYEGGQMKKDIQRQIGLFVRKLPRFDYPVTIHFHWVEGNKRRDLDNIAFAKKFILDTLVSEGKLKDDNRRCVTGFIDTFAYGSRTCCILKIERSKNVTD